MLKSYCRFASTLEAKKTVHTNGDFSAGQVSKHGIKEKVQIPCSNMLYMCEIARLVVTEGLEHILNQICTKRWFGWLTTVLTK